MARSLAERFWDRETINPNDGSSAYSLGRPSKVATTGQKKKRAACWGEAGGLLQGVS